MAFQRVSVASAALWVKRADHALISHGAALLGLACGRADDVKWEASDIKWASRWDTYLLMGDEQIHWFSIVNSLMIVLFLTGMVRHADANSHCADAPSPGRAAIARTFTRAPFKLQSTFGG